MLPVCEDVRGLPDCRVLPGCQVVGLPTLRSADEHRDVAADVVQAIVTCVDVLVIAEAGQRDEDDDEAGLHDEPGEGHGQG